MHEQEILKLIISGDREVFKTVYQKWYAELCIYAQHFTSDADEAEDIVQNILVKLWDKRNSLKSVKSLKSYLYRMVHNACLNKHEHTKVKEKHKSEALATLHEFEIEAYSIDDETNDFSNLKSALEKLPEKNRNIFKMHYFQGLKHKEIAEQLNISDRTVETHIVKGLRKLRELLKKSYTFLIM